MARITVEDCLTKERNRFALIHLASKRTKQLLRGAKSLLDERRDNKAVVSSLREIAAGRVTFMTDEEALAAREADELAAAAALESSRPPVPVSAPLPMFQAEVAAPVASDGDGSDEEPVSRNGDSTY